MDRISIRGLKVTAIVGHHAWERRLPRTLLLDLEIGADAARAAKSDDLKDALDYDAVARAMIDYAASSRAQLIETLAHGLAEKLLQEFGKRPLKLTVHKPGAVPAAQSVSVTVERG